jgi:hypothetical protein
MFYTVVLIMFTSRVCYTGRTVATYKLIQDIEAEDKILGPLTLRQFIFALVAVFLFYICFISLAKGLAFLLVLFLPPALFCGFFAFPFGRDQPTELWALAKIRFWFKPRRRVWNQSGVKELVTITVPKKVEHILTNGLSQMEVKSRLHALADTIDSRGWATKNVGVNTYITPQVAGADSDRLVGIDEMPQQVPTYEVLASDDILDAANNPIAQQFDTMINMSSQVHRQQLMDQLNGVRETEAAGPAGAQPDAWFMNQAPSTAAPIAVPAPVAATDTGNEAELSASLAARSSSRQESFGNLRTVQPLADQAAAPIAPMGPPPDAAGPADTILAAAQTAVTAPSDPAILSLAKNDDFNVATLAREARKNRDGGDRSQNEVVISLH